MVGSRFGVDKEDGGAARPEPRSFVDDLEARSLHRIEGAARIDDAEGYVSGAGAASVALDGLVDRRLGRERLEQLNQVGSVTDLQQDLANLVAPKDLFAVNFAKAKELVGFNLCLELAGGNRKGDVINKLNSGVDGGVC
jgi:hypothetical protein